MWKYISTKKDYQDSISGNQKVFLASLKRVLDSSTILHRHKNNRTRIVMDPSFRGKLAKHMAKGEVMHLAIKHAMTTKTENAKKKATKMARAKATKTARGIAKRTKVRNAKSAKASKLRAKKTKAKL